MDDIAFITISYAPDFERCKRLCESIDQFVDTRYIHHVICPQHDRHLFDQLKNPRRQILSYQEVLPKTYRHVPITKKWWLDPHLFPVRGWMLQQLLKIASHKITQAEVLFFIDSDIFFFKAFNPEILLSDNKIRLYRVATEAPSPLHEKWLELAEEILELPPSTFTQDYIGPLTTWKRSNVIAMLQHIEKVAGKPWHFVIGHQMTISEYILYGNFVDRVLGESNQHFHRANLLSFNIWDPQELKNLQATGKAVDPDICALLIQSNIGLDKQQEQALIAELLKT